MLVRRHMRLECEHVNDRARIACFIVSEVWITALGFPESVDNLSAFKAPTEGFKNREQIKSRSACILCKRLYTPSRHSFCV